MKIRLQVKEVFALGSRGIELTNFIAKQLQENPHGVSRNLLFKMAKERFDVTDGAIRSAVSRYIGDNISHFFVIDKNKKRDLVWQWAGDEFVVLKDKRVGRKGSKNPNGGRPKKFEGVDEATRDKEGWWRLSTSVVFTILGLPNKEELPQCYYCKAFMRARDLLWCDKGGLNDDAYNLKNMLLELKREDIASAEETLAFGKALDKFSKCRRIERREQW
jgi:hypothetical protein